MLELSPFSLRLRSAPATERIAEHWRGEDPNEPQVLAAPDQLLVANNAPASVFGGLDLARASQIGSVFDGLLPAALDVGIWQLPPTSQTTSRWRSGTSSG